MVDLVGPGIVYQISHANYYPISEWAQWKFCQSVMRNFIF